MSNPPITTDIDVLREMVRLAEKRREEELESTERLNKYNLALVGFSGSFLSLLVSTSFPKDIVQLAGIFLLSSIVLSLIAVRPKIVKGGSISIDIDIETIRKGETVLLHTYLLETADLLDRANNRIIPARHSKLNITISSAICLAIALFITYILYAYA